MNNAEYMRKRRANPEYREKERKRQLELYHEKMKDPKYAEKRQKYKREYMKKYMVARCKKDPVFRLKNNISNAVYLSLKGNKRGRRWESLVGYSLGNLIKRIEGQFDNKMNWGNYGSYWQIDHILPLYCFKKDVIKAWALSNLRPLEAKENIRKSNKLILT